MEEYIKKQMQNKFWQYMDIWQPVIDELCELGYTKDQAILMIGFYLSGE